MSRGTDSALCQERELAALLVLCLLTDRVLWSACQQNARHIQAGQFEES